MLIDFHVHVFPNQLAEKAVQKYLGYQIYSTIIGLLKSKTTGFFWLCYPSSPDALMEAVRIKKLGLYGYQATSRLLKFLPG